MKAEHGNEKTGGSGRKRMPSKEDRILDRLKAIESSLNNLKRHLGIEDVPLNYDSRKGGRSR